MMRASAGAAACCMALMLSVTQAMGQAQPTKANLLKLIDEGGGYVSAKQVGSNWPFIATKGIVSCPAAGAVGISIEQAGAQKQYALNEPAHRAGFNMDLSAALKTFSKTTDGLAFLTDVATEYCEKLHPSVVPAAAEHYARAFGGIRYAADHIITISDYQQLEEGDLKSNVIAFLGRRGEMMSSSSTAGHSSEMWEWTNPDGSLLTILFSDGQLSAKSQFRLRPQRKQVARTMTVLDPHGQPYNLHFNRARRAERDLSELLGLAKGLLADGRVSEEESALVAHWVATHPDAVEQWPVNLLAQRLEKIFSDGRADEAERLELHEILTALVGGTAGVILGADTATELPLDDPPPTFTWTGTIFVFTGKFAFGTRADCQRAVTRLGAYCEPNLTQRTTYLVIGTFGSRDWVHTSFGRKIEKAVAYRSADGRPVIVGEDHWAQCVMAVV